MLISVTRVPAAGCPGLLKLLLSISARWLGAQGSTVATSVGQLGPCRTAMGCIYWALQGHRSVTGRLGFIVAAGVGL